MRREEKLPGRHDKLSSDKDAETRFIIKFTFGFVVVASVLLIVGYVVLSATGVLGNAIVIGPTPTPAAPTPKPTWSFIGVPTDTPGPATPTPFVPTPSPTPTPAPTPVPSPYKIKTQIMDEYAIRAFTVIYTALPGSQSLDMSRTSLSVSYGDTVYCSYPYKDALYWMDGNWTNSNGDTMLDPNGETVYFRITPYALNIPENVETRLILYFDGAPLVSVPLPALKA